MQKKLIVVATPIECELIINRLNAVEQAPGYYVSNYNKSIDVLITGIGMVNCAYRLAVHLSRYEYTQIWNIGICGSYRYDFPLGTVVEVRAETYIDLGVETQEKFLTLEDLGFPNFFLEALPIYNTILNPNPPYTDYSPVNGATVNTVTGTQNTATDRRLKWQKDIETMESAAFFQICVETKKNFIALRAISNYVEKRNLTRWQLRQTIYNVQQALLKYIV